MPALIAREASRARRRRDLSRCGWPTVKLRRGRQRRHLPVTLTWVRPASAAPRDRDPPRDPDRWRSRRGRLLRRRPTPVGALPLARQQLRRPHLGRRHRSAGPRSRHRPGCSATNPLIVAVEAHRPCSTRRRGDRRSRCGPAARAPGPPSPSSSTPHPSQERPLRSVEGTPPTSR